MINLDLSFIILDCINYSCLLDAYYITEISTLDTYMGSITYEYDTLFRYYSFKLAFINTYVRQTRFNEPVGVIMGGLYINIQGLFYRFLN